MGDSPSRPTVAVVVVSYNTADLLLECVAAVLPQLADDDVLVVYDNASIDGSADRVAAAHPSVRVLRGDWNIGFGAACNAAAAATVQDFVLLLNPDGVAHPGLIDALLDCAARRPDAAIYGGRTVDRDGRVDPRSCWAAPTLWSTFCYASGLTSVFRRSAIFDPESLGRWDRDSERHVNVVTGCLMLIQRDWWDRLGGFDERFFVYGEDLDLCLRARALGAHPIITPDAVLTHHVGASSTRADKLCLLLAGKITVFEKHFGIRYRPARGALVIGTALRATISALTRGRVGSPWRTVWSRRREWADGFPRRGHAAGVP